MESPQQPSTGARPPAARGARALRELGLAALLLLAAWLALEAFAVKVHPDHTDEAEWIAISIVHFDQLVHGAAPPGAQQDPPGRHERSPWARGVQDTVFGYMNPCLPKLVLGAVLHAAGHREASPLVFEVYQRDDRAGGLLARAALEPAMPLARRVIQTLAALSAVLVFFVARELLDGRSGALAGALGFALLLASPLVLHTATYIRTDYFMVTCALGTLLVALRARDALSGRRGGRAMALAGLLLGLGCGLAVSGKLNGILLCACAALWVPIAWWRAHPRGERRAWRDPLVTLVLAGLAACVVFYALNPRLWGEPLEGVRDVLARWDRQLEVQGQRAARMGIEPAEGPAEQVAVFVDRLDRFDPWRSLTGLPGGLALTLGGLVLLGWRALRPARDERSAAAGTGAALVLVFALAYLTGSGLLLPLHWGRFALPTAPCVALLDALALASIVTLAGSAWRRRGRAAT